MSEYLPGLAGVPATKSNISDIDGEKGILAYRGYTIEDLAANSTFEETALLLLDGRLPTRQELENFSHQLIENRRIKFIGSGLLKPNDRMSKSRRSASFTSRTNRSQTP